jgi:hypothetical protein
VARTPPDQARLRRNRRLIIPPLVVMVAACIPGAINKLHGHPSAGPWPWVFLGGWLWMMTSGAYIVLADRRRPTSG